MAHSWRHICAPSLAAAAVKNALILSVRRIGWKFWPFNSWLEGDRSEGSPGSPCGFTADPILLAPLVGVGKPCLDTCGCHHWSLPPYPSCFWNMKVDRLCVLPAPACRKKPSLAFLVCQQAQGQGVGSSLLALSGNHRRKSAEVSIAGSLRWRLNPGSPWHSAGLLLKCEHGSLLCVSPTPLQRCCPAAPCMNLTWIPWSPRTDDIIRLNDFISRNLEAAFTCE